VADSTVNPEPLCATSAEENTEQNPLGFIKSNVLRNGSSKRAASHAICVAKCPNLPMKLSVELEMPIWISTMKQRMGSGKLRCLSRAKAADERFSLIGWRSMLDRVREEQPELARKAVASLRRPRTRSLQRRLHSTDHLRWSVLSVGGSSVRNR
jgi:hypothetical protein